MRTAARRAGYTLIEMMIVVAIIGALVLAAPRLFLKVYQFTQLALARVEIQKNARGALSNINRDLRQALSGTIEIDSAPGQPPHSRVTFSKYGAGGQPVRMRYYQRGTSLYQAVGSSETGKLMAANLRYIAFTYPRTDNDELLSISITFEKATYEGGTKALQMAVEKVRIMN